jgi:branched-chain amino acid transport system permease protein
MKKSIILLIFGLLLGLVFIRESFFLMILSTVLIYGIASLGLNILMGFTGQLSIGHAAFMAIGAYTTSYLSINFGTPFILNLIIAIIFSAILGVLISLPALRLKGFYLAIATMAFGITVEQLIASVEAFGGHIGIRNIPDIMPNDFWMYILNLAFYVVLSFIATQIIKSPNGISYQMTRDSEYASRSFGKRISFVKLESFIISAVYGGIAGVLYAHTIGYIGPTDFSLTASLNLLAMIVIGGLASIDGGLIGAVIITGMPFLFSRTDIPMSIIFGSLLIIFVLFFPKGLIYGIIMGYYKYFERPFVALSRKLWKKKSKPSEKVNVNGKDLYYNVKGEGEPVIMIHGNFGSHRWFDKVNDLKGYKTYALDLPNFGHSDRIDNINIDTYANYVKEFMKKLGIETAYVVAHSFGGAVAQSLAYNNPNMVKKLVLVDSAPVDGLNTPEENYNGLQLLKTSKSLLKNSLKATIPTSDDKKMLNILTNEGLLMNPKCFIENARALESYDFTDIAKNYENPVLFFVGKKDLLITKEMAEKTLEKLNGKLKYFDHVGHSIIIEDPELFKKELTSFLE